MSWIRRSPFKSQEEAIRHMVGLLAAEAKSANSPLREEELDMLSRECGLPEALEDQAKRIVGQILIRDFEAGYEDPKSFSSSLEWAGDPEYPNIARLTEDVVLEGRASGRFPLPPRLHGWGLVKDKLSLIGCGLLIVAVVLVVGGLLFSR